MVLARAWGSVVAGIAAVPVLVEVEVMQGLPAMHIVGMAGTAVTEARWRVRSAMEQVGWTWPINRITVSLSPAEMPKHGTSLDLAIALATHCAQDNQSCEEWSRTVVVGELGLDGSVRHVRGALAMTVMAAQRGYQRVIVPAVDAHECARVPGIDVFAIESLADLGAVVERAPLSKGSEWSSVDQSQSDWSDIHGQEDALFAAVVAAVGAHHLALFGSPGLGKSMIAHRFDQILPDLDPALAIEVMALHSLGSLRRETLRPPVQAPHHSASPAAVLGTAVRQQVVPGALTLAHGGVLVLDEVPEFARSTLEGLRQPWESGVISVHRAGWSGELPARVQVVMTANPCPCGWFGVVGGQRCNCPPHLVRAYQARLSGPLLDRIDIAHTLSPLNAHGPAAPRSEQVRGEVAEARARARKRWGGAPTPLNAWVSAALMREHTTLSSAAEKHLDSIARRGRRGVDRVVRVAWSIADLAGAERLQFDHVVLAAKLWGRTDALEATRA